MKVAVFGAGTMGSGIAQVFAAKGHTALMYASSTASAQRHKDKLAASLNKKVAKGKMTQEAADDIMSRVLVEECGLALQRKFAGCDPFFETAEYTRWAETLIRRMVSPLLNDEVTRVSRDLARKLGWQDRLIGAIRLCIDTGTPCPTLMRMAALAARFRALDELQTEWPPEGAELAQKLGREA